MQWYSLFTFAIQLRIQDHVFAFVTFAIWVATFFYYGVIDMSNGKNTGTAIAAFVLYGLTVDNVL